MSFHPAPNSERLSSRRVWVFLSIGIAMVILGAADIDDGKFFVLAGCVIAAFNGVALYRRWADRSR